LNVIFLILGPPENFCKNKDDGKYANPKDNSQFFSCNDNIASACLRCPGNLIYKAECDQCLHPDVPCPTQTTVTQGQGSGSKSCPPANYCKGKADGTFANPSNDKMFFSCVNGRETACQDCPPSLVFNEACKQCNYPTAKCVSSSTMAPQTTQSQSGGGAQKCTFNIS